MEGMLSPADVAVLANRNGGNSGFGNGDMGAWWIIIFLIFAFGGFGNRGFGSGNGSNGGGAMDNYVLASDFAQLSRQLDNGFDRIADATTQINNGLCNGFYQELVNINGVNSNIMQGNFALQSQLASCCCGIERAIDGVNYNTQSGFNGINQTLCTATRDIIENQNANYRALHDEIVANRIEDKNAQITAQQNEINTLRLAASQATQNEYLLNQLRTGCPVNAQLVCGNTPIPVQYIGAGCGCNNNCYGNY